MTDPRPPGATAATGESKKRPIWPWVLLALVIIGLLIWWLVAALTGSDDDDVSTDASTSIEQTTESSDEDASVSTTEPPEPTEATASPTSTTPGVGVLLVGDIEAFAPGADVSLAIGDPAVANSVQIQAVVADEAFYIGPEPGQTVLVRLKPFAGTDDPESPTSYEAGDTVSFSGTVREVDQAFLDGLALYEPAPQLETGDVYVQADEITTGG